jgi:hypothetical protein
MNPPIAAPTLAPATAAMLTPDRFSDNGVGDGDGVEEDVVSLDRVPKVCNSTCQL